MEWVIDKSSGIAVKITTLWGLAHLPLCKGSGIFSGYVGEMTSNWQRTIKLGKQDNGCPRCALDTPTSCIDW